MTLLFHYKPIQVHHPLLTLGGRWSRPRTLIAVSLVGPTGTWLTEGLLDTGADDTVFPEDMAARIGLDLTNASTGQGSGATLAGVPIRYAQIFLRLTDGVEQRQWPAWVGFTPARLYRPMLGFAGFLQFFTATFHGDRERVELAVNSLYPGT